MGDCGTARLHAVMIAVKMLFRTLGALNAI